jgi:hypothetical protein
VRDHLRQLARSHAVVECQRELIRHRERLIARDQAATATRLRSLGDSPALFHRLPPTRSRRYRSRAGATFRVYSGDSRISARSRVDVAGSLRAAGVHEEAMTATAIPDAIPHLMCASLSVLLVCGMLQPVNVLSAHVLLNGDVRQTRGG